MKFLLDTNICIHYFRGQYELNKKFDNEGLQNLAISVITLAELVFGAENSKNPQKNLEIINSFVNKVSVIPIIEAVYLYGKEKVRLRNSGLMINDFDLLIGCTAVENNFIMVTENIKEFQRISNINIENWVVR